MPGLDWAADARLHARAEARGVDTARVFNLTVSAVEFNSQDNVHRSVQAFSFLFLPRYYYLFFFVYTVHI
jgi:hypothetical protein